MNGPPSRRRPIAPVSKKSAIEEVSGVAEGSDAAAVFVPLILFACANMNEKPCIVAGAIYQGYPLK